ncbi:hypothetical protein PVAP13_8KG139300 [Panicum virgatum]|uniref:Uncharacterized protein n=1 Tax=Panicum virgatum TaxID=38727 RepID=A0A8T0PSR8_PANVG|nr:hypothetical protein PVAP13_8KG139300 [Panicum virgatum]
MRPLSCPSSSSHAPPSPACPSATRRRAQRKKLGLPIGSLAGDSAEGKVRLPPPGPLLPCIRAPIGSGSGSSPPRFPPFPLPPRRGIWVRVLFLRRFSPDCARPSSRFSPPAHARDSVGGSVFRPPGGFRIPSVGVFGPPKFEILACGGLSLGSLDPRRLCSYLAAVATEVRRECCVAIVLPVF